MEKDRKSKGKPREGVIIPVPPQLSEMDDVYFDLRNSIVTRIKETRLRFVIQANHEYWQ